MKKLLLSAAVALISASAIAAPKSTKVTQQTSGNEVILHAWSWSFNTIADNMKQIAEAGYDFVQTSPANTCYVGDGGGLSLFSPNGPEASGKWYFYYQPIDWKIGNHMLGTRDEFKAMCDSARKYNVRVIVDVLPNHTAFDRSAVTADLLNAVGGMDNLYHSDGMREVKDYNDRYQCTLNASGGLPDVNTENPDFQYYYLQYVNDLINLGARGLRYDTAKHIGLPTDPVDPKNVEMGYTNNFWDVALGHEAAEGLSLLVPDSLYVYGEVLQDRNTKETEYADYMDLVASGYGHVLRHAIEAQNAGVEDLVDWHHPARPDQLVTWVESHDTYCNGNESAKLTDDQIRMGWVFITSRSTGTPLFFSRPAGSTRDNYYGDNKVGPRGNDEFFHPEVVAANNFRHAMIGQPEQIYVGSDGAVIEVARGAVGASFVNFTDKQQKVEMPCNLPDGKYTDKVHDTQFTVKGGVIKGKMAPFTAYIIYE